MINSIGGGILHSMNVMSLTQLLSLHYNRTYIDNIYRYLTFYLTHPPPSNISILSIAYKNQAVFCTRIAAERAV